MNIKTITCHDVYNVGASLQAYALAHYLQLQGHEVEIINYKPDYLSKHYSLWGVSNSKYNKPFFRELYQILKLPGRIKARYGKRKKAFDSFTQNMLPLTENRYTSNESLKDNPPEGDVFFAGSDQIWNTLFRNGRDPAFYLDFVPAGKIKASYAASFATENIVSEWRVQVKLWLSKLDYISVRESSAVEMIRGLGLTKAVQVMDPVFLLERKKWNEIETDLGILEPYILIYDFDNNQYIKQRALRLANKNKWKIYSVFNNDYCDRSFYQEGPLTFISLVHHAQYVISNSFHATAFSLIYEKNFEVFCRNESINTRMLDLIKLVGLESCLINEQCMEKEVRKIDYSMVEGRVSAAIERSKEYIKRVLQAGE